MNIAHHLVNISVRRGASCSLRWHVSSATHQRERERERENAHINSRVLCILSLIPYAPDTYILYYTHSDATAAAAVVT